MTIKLRLLDDKVTCKLALVRHTFIKYETAICWQFVNALNCNSPPHEGKNLRGRHVIR